MKINKNVVYVKVYFCVAFTIHLNVQRLKSYFLFRNIIYLNLETPCHPGPTWVWDLHNIDYVNFYTCMICYSWLIFCVYFSMPKPVFHSNGKKTVHQRIQHHVITPQHEEIIRYISESKYSSHRYISSSSYKLYK